MKPWGRQHFNRPSSWAKLCLAAQYPVLEVPLEGEGKGRNLLRDAYVCEDARVKLSG